MDDFGHQNLKEKKATRNFNFKKILISFYSKITDNDHAYRPTTCLRVCCCHDNWSSIIKVVLQKTKGSSRNTKQPSKGKS